MKGLASILFRFMGSMNLAITLLVAVALSSVIGTLLKQNESYQSYIIKFGPFWHELYLSLGLYDVYSSAWFIGILSFLVISTSICITQNGPGILRSMQRFRESISAQSLRTMKQYEEWRFNIDIDTAYNGLCYFLKRKAPGSIILSRMPSYDLLDEVMYKSIALGFAFFTIATILDALWAAEAWDPKETWALIIWLNYAAWLHMRMTKGWKGSPMAW